MTDRIGPDPLWLRPLWPAAARVQAAFSLRAGGVSRGPYASLNLALHVGDDREAVAENRRRLRAALALPREPLWLDQRHGTVLVEVERLEHTGSTPEAAISVTPPADAAVSRTGGAVLAVLVADCLAVLLARADGSAVAIAHAGWRGLAAGVLESAVGALGGGAQRLHAWLGPAIGREHFEVGEEVREAFCRREPQAAEAFEPNAAGRWQCDLHALARARLAALGVHSVHGERRCSFAQPEAFYSFRREGLTGRMAALIWLQP